MFCSECGARARDGARFCGKCGRPLFPASISQPESKTVSDVSHSQRPEKFPPIRPTYEATQAPQGPDRHLSGDVRQQYIAELQEYQDGWIWALALIVAGVVFVLMKKLGLWSGLWNVLWGIVALYAGMLVAAGVESIVDTRGRLNSHSDGMLELLYNNMERKKQFKRLTSRIVTTIVVIASIMIVVVGGGVLLSNENVKQKLRELTSKANCVVMSHRAYENVFIDAAEPDYGYTVVAAVKNVGDDGEISLVVKLTSREGQFERKQSISVKSGEVANVKYDFPEPTIDALIVQTTIHCSPKK